MKTFYFISLLVLLNVCCKKEMNHTCEKPMLLRDSVAAPAQMKNELMLQVVPWIDQSLLPKQIGC
jgi:hypothetical protein